MLRTKMVACCFLVFGVTALAAPALATTTPGALVTLSHTDGSTLSFAPFADIAPGTIGSITSGDLGTDGVAELIVGAGAGMPPYVSVLRQDGSTITRFLAYNEGFTGGVNVAVCDLDSDREGEIVTGAKFGGGPHVRIFDAQGNPLTSFFAYATDFRGGVNVACGDINGDGSNEIITGSGLTGGPHIKVFSKDGDLLAETFNGDVSENMGSYVGVEDGILLTVPMGGERTEVASFALQDATLVPVVHVTTRTRNTLATTANVSADTTATAEILSDLFSDTSPQYILVDVSDQRLTAYAFGVPVRSFLVSTGVASLPTPLGKTQIFEKLLWHDYAWNYGANNPNNYNLPNVQYNLHIYKHIYIHYAYWHNNFGHPMSHGCVNVGYDDAAWIYNWANVGTPVEIVQ